ncbi:hypothetical protein TSUD_399760 [Trifolium subterraneum]|uniref:Protein kinase domain-containing protein n=1 Tax=Trifolium subterraneum TaxID=3900 RepID=A0A2Z6NI70_TRISU|nr:hypothetical protein TSUD_399760 [Trifolium subterraneum]
MSLSLSCAITKPFLKFNSTLKYQQQRPNISLALVRCESISKDSSGENELQEKRSKLDKGSPIIIIEAPKMIKTAASVPCLRVNSGLVKPGDVGRNKFVLFEGSSYNFDLEDLLRASGEVLGKVSYGSSYKATLLLEEEEAMIVVVIRLEEVVVGKKEFEQHMEILERVGQHTNVVPLGAYYFSKDEKIMVYDYVPAANLSTLLHGSRSGGRTPLDWDLRVKVSLGTARGIAHIHSVGGTKFTHGNIMSSNVLLNQDNDGCISDFGLTSLINVPANPSRPAGYRAPEVIKTGKHSHKSDVYSFGVLLLELLTGKVPLQSPGHDDMDIDLPRWVHSVVREEWTAEVFDLELKM